MRGGILPPRIILFRKGIARYIDDGHSHDLDGIKHVEKLPFKVRHDDRKPLSRWLSSQLTYASQEADKIHGSRFSQLGFADRVRKMVFVAPLSVFVLVYVLRGSFFSGWRGLFYSAQRCFAELTISLHILDRKLGKQG